jgi:hypothetical protein
LGAYYVVWAVHLLARSIKSRGSLLDSSISSIWGEQYSYQMASREILLNDMTTRCNPLVDNTMIQPPHESWLVRKSPCNDYVNDLASSNPRLHRPDSEQKHLPGVSWDSRVFNSRIVTFRDGERPDVSISTAVKSDCLSEHLSH